MQKRSRYNREFKLEALRMLTEENRAPSEIANELGIKRTLLYRWKDQLQLKGDKAFHDRPGRPTNDGLDEVTRLKQELKAVTEERDILKKAAAYFARDLM
jgi:transposase